MRFLATAQQAVSSTLFNKNLKLRKAEKSWDSLYLLIGLFQTHYLKKSETAEKLRNAMQQDFSKTDDLPLKKWEKTQQVVLKNLFLKKKVKLWKSWENPCNCATGNFKDIWYFTRKPRFHTTCCFEHTIKKGKKAEKTHATTHQAFSKTDDLSIIYATEQQKL